MKKVLRILSLVLVFVLALAPVTLAVDFTVEPTEVTGDVTTKIQTASGNIVWILQLVGYSLAAIIGVWMGIQWILAQPAKKAELKGKLWSVVIGIVLLVGTTAILPLVWDGIAGTFN